MRQLVISEQDNVAALMDNGKAIDFIISKNDFSVGDVYAVTVENIMQSINAVFVKLQEGQMGFLHANDIPGRGLLNDRLSPGQRLLVQIVKEPTGNKGPRVNLAISIPGRYYVLTSENKNIAISRRISDNAERDKLRSITNLMKPEELGVVIRTEASGRSQEELEEDFLNIWEKWKNVVDKYDRTDGCGPIFKESDFLYSTLRDYYNNNIDEIVVGGIQARYKCQEHLKSWTGREVNVNYHEPDQILIKTDVIKELRNCLSNRVNLPSGGYIIIQGMEALTAIDINSGKFTSSNTLRETVRRTNMEAAVEIARQMRLRNIGGMIIVDFIDMADRADRIAVIEVLESAVRSDKAKPQIGQLSDLCLVEITRKRSGQSLAEVFGNTCHQCNGSGVIFNLKGGDETHSHFGGRRSSRPAPHQRSGGYQQRNDRNDRGGERDRSERSDRLDRDSRDRSERMDRGDRPERVERQDRGDRPERTERPDRGERADRGDRQERSGGERPERTDRPDRGGDRQGGRPGNRNRPNNRYGNRDFRDRRNNRQGGGFRPGGPDQAAGDAPATDAVEAHVSAENSFVEPAPAPDTSSELTRSKTFSATHMVDDAPGAGFTEGPATPAAE